MAIALVLVCSVFGFGSAVAAMVLFDFGLVQAFALWISTGLVALIIAVLPALVPRRDVQADQQAEST